MSTRMQQNSGPAARFAMPNLMNRTFPGSSVSVAVESSAPAGPRMGMGGRSSTRDASPSRGVPQSRGSYGSPVMHSGWTQPGKNRGRANSHDPLGSSIGEGGGMAGPMLGATQPWMQGQGSPAMGERVPLGFGRADSSGASSMDPNTFGRRGHQYQKQDDPHEMARALMAASTTMTKKSSTQSSTQGAADEAKQEIIGILTVLQQNIETSQRQQAELMADMATRWEERFVKIEKDVQQGLYVANTTAASVGERVSKVMGLGEVLERALAQMEGSFPGDSSSEVLTRIAKVEKDVESLLLLVAAKDKDSSWSSNEDIARLAETQAKLLQAMKAGSTPRQTPSPNSTSPPITEVSPSLRQLAQEQRNNVSGRQGSKEKTVTFQRMAYGGSTGGSDSLAGSDGTPTSSSQAGARQTGPSAIQNFIASMAQARH
mmetsp:Transcript_66610/g.145227  ORF Transcript_66610/g.145227 Transcript_66610/m.145227 type:complete len:430 (-) Transcript_66610:139-1428(-)